MPLKIAIDLDCTVLNTTERLVEYINERVPVNLKIEDITSYSIEAALPEQYQWIVDSGFRDKEMWRGVQVLPYAADVIKKLYDEGHEIFFATSSLPENLRKKINHLSRNMHLPKEYIERHTININDKYLCGDDVEFAANKLYADFGKRFSAIRADSRRYLADLLEMQTCLKCSRPFNISSLVRFLLRS